MIMTTKKKPSFTLGVRESTFILLEAKEKIQSGQVKGLTELLDTEKREIAFLKSTGHDPEAMMALARKGDINDPRVLKKFSTKTVSDPDAWRGDTPWDNDDDYLDTGKFSLGRKGPYKADYKKCAHSHPLLTIEGVGTIQGASCYSPQRKFDIEIFLCGGAKLPSEVLPFGTQYVRYSIVDQQAPDNFEKFDQLLDWTIAQMKSGKTVHVGCIGGHGRTGLFLAALVKKTLGIEDAVTWVRENYCHKAVESVVQVNWLYNHYGIKKTKVANRYGGVKTIPQASTAKEKNDVSKIKFSDKGWSGGDQSQRFAPLKDRSIFGQNKLY